MGWSPSSASCGRRSEQFEEPMISCFPTKHRTSSPPPHTHPAAGPQRLTPARRHHTHYNMEGGGRAPTITYASVRAWVAGMGPCMYVYVFRRHQHICRPYEHGVFFYIIVYV